MRPWIFALLLWTAVVSLSLYHNWHLIEQHGLMVATNRARFSFRMIETMRFWNSYHGGVYVPIDNKNPPNPYLDVPDRDISTASGLKLTRINPAYMTRQVGELIKKQQDWLLRIVSLKPLNPKNSADPWETETLKDFESGTKERITLLSFDELPTFRYMAPLITKKVCLDCHAKQGYQVGDIRGGISISFPATTVLSTTQQQKYYTITLHIAIWLILSGAIILFQQRIRQHFLELEAIRKNQKDLIEERTAKLCQEVKIRKETEYFLRSITDSAMDAIISADAKGEISTWNRGAQLLFGYKKKEVLGKPLTILIPKHLRAPHLKGLQQALERRELRLGNQIMDLVGLHKDGSEFPVEISLSTWVTDEQRYFSSVIRDITDRKQSEKQSQEAQQFSSSVIKSMSGIFYLFTQEGLLTRWNKNFQEISGYHHEEMLGKHALDFIPEEERILVGQRIQEVFEKGEATVEGHLLTKDHRKIPYLFSGTRVHIGHQQYLSGTGLDITDLKAAEQARNASEAQYKQLFTDALDMIHIVDMDGNIIDANPIHLTTLGYEREEFLNQHLLNIIHPDYRTVATERLKQVLNGEPVIGYQTALLTRTGESVHIEMNAVTEFDHQGQAVGARAILRDITQRKQMENILRQNKETTERANLELQEEIRERQLIEEALLKSENRFRTFFENSSDAVMLLGRETFLDCNQATLDLFGLKTREAFICKHPSDLSPPTLFDCDARTLADERIQTALEKGFHLFEWIHRRQDTGEDFPAEVLLTPMELDGKLIVHATVRDISEKKAAEQELLEARDLANAASQAKSIFLATMSHEIRTPMNAILGMIELLEETELSDTQTWCVRTLNRSGQTLMTLINDILDLSKIEAGQLILEKRTLNLWTFIEETIESFMFTALDKKIELGFQIEPTTPKQVKGDITRLRQVLMNLIGNALKFTKEGWVKVNVCGDRDHCIRFSIQDSGLGIAQKQQEEIFKPFTQADASTTRNYGGTGLGLTICQRLVDLMEGEFSLESELGQGSTFTFIVPLPPVDITDTKTASPAMNHPIKVAPHNRVTLKRPLK
ncbi:PAS domain S-box protein, partial [Magnetococcales bacterium HHB-1]